MEPFLQSVARSFEENRDSVPALGVTLLIVGAALAATLLLAAGRRALARRARLRRLAGDHGLTAGELALLGRLAERAALEPSSLLTHLDHFERATAQALAEQRDEPPGAREALVAELGRIRRALGFERLPAHTPLLTTRELAPGTAVEVGDLHGQAHGITEASFLVEVREPPAAGPGDTLTLGLVHAREARYTARCRLLAIERGRAGDWQLRLAHDEAPARIQQREYVRVAVRGSVVLHPVSPWPVAPGLETDVLGELVDVSGGGALVRTAPELPVGLLVGASFRLGPAQFKGLRAVVLSADPPLRGRSRARLEFSGIPEGERDRLVAAVAHLQLVQEARAEPLR